MTTVAKSLSTALDIVSAPTKRPKQYQHSFVLLSCHGGNSMNLETRNDRLQMLAPCECQSDPFEALVHADHLKTALTGLSGAITLTPTDAGLVVKSGARRITVPTLPIADDNWPQMPRPAINHRLLLETATIGKSIFSAANLAKHSNMPECLVVNLLSGTRCLYVFGTNRKSLLEFRHPYEAPGEIDVEIPQDVAHLIAALADDLGAKDFTLGIGERHIVAVVDSVEIVCTVPATPAGVGRKWLSFKPTVGEPLSHHIVQPELMNGAIASAARVNEEIHLNLNTAVEIRSAKEQSEFYDSIEPITSKGEASIILRAEEAVMAFSSALTMPGVTLQVTDNYAAVANPFGTFFLRLVRK